MSAKDKELRLERQEQRTAALDQTASGPASPDTPQARLLRVARAGGFEALVAEARPAQPVAMVTPEEREAALRAAGQWPAAGPAALEEKEKDKKKSKRRKKKPAAEPPTELTPNEAFIAEHCRWVPLAERGRDRPRRHIEGRYLTEYDPITGEIIGDGYVHYDDDEDDAW